MGNDQRVSLYEKELLHGADFMSQYAQELGELYGDEEFRGLIERIREDCIAEETHMGIRRGKMKAAYRLRSNIVARRFPALGEIVDKVVAEGFAENTAHISAFCAMRILDISSRDTCVSACPEQAAERSVAHDSKTGSATLDTAVLPHDPIAEERRERSGEDVESISTVKRKCSNCANMDTSKCAYNGMRLCDGYVYAEPAPEYWPTWEDMRHASDQEMYARLGETWG